MIDHNSVEISAINLGADEYEEVIQNLRILYTTPEGTVPFDRRFGIDMSFIDEPLPVAKGKIMVQYRQKTLRYEPRVIVEEVTFDTSSLDGKLIPKVVLSFDIDS